MIKYKKCSLIGVRNNTSRINWLDVSRGLAFLMVIYSHLEYCDDSVMQFFKPVFLTTFFFVSGYLHKSGVEFGKFFEQRTRTLLWPVLSLGTIMIVLQHIMTFKDAPLPWIDGFKGLLMQNGENTILWFVAALYVYSLLFYWIEKLSSKYLIYVAMALFILNWVFTYVLHVPKIPWHVGYCGYACAYMGLGKWFRGHEVSIDSMVKTWMLVCSSLIYISLIILLGHSCSFNGSEYLIDSLILTILGLFVIIGISKRTVLQDSRFLLFVGSNTLFYFAFHGKVYALLQSIVGKVFSTGILERSLIIDDATGFLITFLDAIILIPFAIIVNKYLPWILGKDFKFWEAK